MKHFGEINHEAIEQFQAAKSEIDRAATADIAGLGQLSAEDARQAALDRIRNEPETREFVDEIFTAASDLIDEYAEGIVRPLWLSKNTKLVPVTKDRGIFGRDKVISERVEHGPMWKNVSMGITKADTYSVDYANDFRKKFHGNPRVVLTCNLEFGSADSHLRDLHSLVIQEELTNFMEHYGYSLEEDAVADVDLYDPTIRSFSHLSNLTFRLSQPEKQQTETTQYF